MEYKVGDKLKVIRSGYGFGEKEIGKTITITEINRTYISNKDGCKIEEKLGNNKLKHLNGVIGLDSFRKDVEN